jgi:hypothetical protein
MTERLLLGSIDLEDIANATLSGARRVAAIEGHLLPVYSGWGIS